MRHGGDYGTHYAPKLPHNLVPNRGKRKREEEKKGKIRPTITKKQGKMFLSILIILNDIYSEGCF